MTKRFLRYLGRKKNEEDYVRLSEKERLTIIEKACKQVSRGVFYSTLIIITSFLPVFLLTGQEGKLFHPLAFTKTFIMIVDAVLVVTLVPVIISRSEEHTSELQSLMRISYAVFCLKKKIK